MRYRFDPVKRSVNLKKHGDDLADARLLIESGRTVTFEDKRFNYDEARYVTMGKFSDIVVVVVTAETDEEIRAISMRRADKYEQEIYYEHS